MADRELPSPERDGWEAYYHHHDGRQGRYRTLVVTEDSASVCAWPEGSPEHALWLKGWSEAKEIADRPKDGSLLDLAAWACKPPRLFECTYCGRVYTERTLSLCNHLEAIVPVGNIFP